MGFLSREIVRRVGPFVAVGAAGAAGALLAQRKVMERRKLSLKAGPPFATTEPVPQPGPAVPAPPPAPAPGPPAPPGPDPEPPTRPG